MTKDNKNKVLNVPTLRFPEFSGEWEVTNLKKISTINPTIEKVENKFAYIDLESVTKGQLNKLKYLTKAEAPSRAQRVLKLNDILFQCVRPYQMNNYIVKSKKEGIQLVASTGYAQLRVEEDIPDFIFNVLNTPRFNKEAMIRCTGSSYPAINSEELSEIQFYKCSIQEQRKIADFLSLLDERIETQKKIIDKYESLIKGIRALIANNLSCNWQSIEELVKQKLILLKRGNIIPKFEYSSEFCYPVYSSSIQNNGLMGYYNSYMFDEELISWSIDGGGNFFYRRKHKFNITNVCGYIKFATNNFNYRFICEMLTYQHSKLVFDYQTKAHPNVIDRLYSVPIITLNLQQKYSNLFDFLYDKLDLEKIYLRKYEEQKKYMLLNLFI